MVIKIDKKTSIKTVLKISLSAKERLNYYLKLVQETYNDDTIDKSQVISAIVETFLENDKELNIYIKKLTQGE
jgi:hypothetical protein